jgi:hypothetical protein
MRFKPKLSYRTRRSRSRQKGPKGREGRQQDRATQGIDDGAQPPAAGTEIPERGPDRNQRAGG